MASIKAAVGVGAALGAVALWATNAFAATVALDRLTVTQLLAVQYTAAALGVGAWRIATRGRRSAPAVAGGSRARVSLAAAGAGVPGLTGTIFLQYAAFATAPIVGANVLAYAWPLIAALWVAATVRTRHALVGAPPAVLGFLGVASIFTGHDPVAAGAELGYALALGSAVCMAVYTVSAGRTAASPAALLLPATVIGAALATTASLLHGAPWPPLGHWWSATYLGLGPMAAGYGLWTYAMADRRADRLGPLGYLTPLLSTALLLATSQPFTTPTLVGAALVLACSTGVLVNERRAQPTRQPATPTTGPPQAAPPEPAAAPPRKASS